MSKKKHKLKRQNDTTKKQPTSNLWQNPTFRFLAKVFGLWVVLLVLVQLPFWENAIIRFLINVNIGALLGLGKILPMSIVSSAPLHVTVAGYTMRVVMECTAYNYFLFILAVCLFHEWSWKWRLGNMLIINGILFVLNLGRFIGLGIVGKFWPHLFDPIHNYLWNILFILATFLLWLWRERKTPGQEA